jgi:hypothetical protein
LNKASKKRSKAIRLAGNKRDSTKTLLANFKYESGLLYSSTFSNALTSVAGKMPAFL